jgi:nucleoside-diphosphate-sugar epimerase
MRALVTGCAGFIGSALTKRLLADGHEVVGVDALRDFYSPALKRAALSPVLGNPNFAFHATDVRDQALDKIWATVDTVFHLAAQAGVRGSWKNGFVQYVEDNILATQHVLESLREMNPKARLVYASSSSVYGDAAAYPTFETTTTVPKSPYGVTKLAGEHLIAAYSSTFGLDEMILRYHTVYGPGQRPDMAINRLIHCALTGSEFPLFAAPGTMRDFTYVEDIVEATIRSGEVGAPATRLLNLSSGAPVAFTNVISLVQELIGAAIQLSERQLQAGDVVKTGANIEAARATLGWAPRVTLQDGLAHQIAWQHESRSTAL